MPQSHLARYVVDVVESLDLSELERAYAGRGSDAYHPAMLLSLLIYGYATGVHSSRKIEAQLKAEVQELLNLAESADQGALPDNLDLPGEIARREDRLAAIAAAKAKIEARAQERFEREQAEYEQKLVNRQARQQASGKNPPIPHKLIFLKVLPPMAHP